MNQLPIPLDWLGPFTFDELLSNEDYRSTKFKVPGVYFWRDTRENESKIIYVGCAKGSPDLWTRQWQHYISIIAGHYQIPEWSQSSGERWGMEPARPEVRKVVFNKNDYHHLVDRGFEYASKLRIFLCPLPFDSPIGRIERQLLWDFQPVETKPGTKSPPSQPIPLIHRNAGWLTESVDRQIRRDVPRETFS